MQEEINALGLRACQVSLAEGGNLYLGMDANSNGSATKLSEAEIDEVKIDGVEIEEVEAEDGSITDAVSIDGEIVDGVDTEKIYLEINSDYFQSLEEGRTYLIELYEQVIKQYT